MQRFNKAIMCGGGGAVITILAAIFGADLAPETVEDVNKNFVAIVVAVTSIVNTVAVIIGPKNKE